MKTRLIIEGNGHRKWFLNNEYHREGGPATEYINGNKFWYLDGDQHRRGGPAVEVANRRYWYLHNIPANKLEAQRIRNH